MTTTTSATVSPAYPTAALEYETPRAGERPRGYGFLVVTASLAAGVLFANSFADAAKFPPDHRPEGAFLRLLCGVLIASLAGAALVSLIRLTRRAADALALAKRTPDRTIGFVLVGCGTIGVLAAAGLEVFVLKYGAVHVASVGIAPSYVMPGPVLLAQLLCVVIFVAGVAQSAVGVWALLMAPRRD